MTFKFANGLVEYHNGSKYWYKDSKFHRLDGPAVEWPVDYKAWWAYGVYYGNTNMGMTQEKFERLMKLKAFL